MKIANNIK